MTSSHPQGGAWLKTSTRRRDALQRVSFDAAGLWFAMSMWCAATGARGVVPWEDLHVAVDRKITEQKARKLVKELARDGIELVATDPDAGIDLGDFWREENPDADTWHDPVKRERWARDKRLKRDSELCKRIKERDRNLCRYCGIRVNWNDKVGPSGGTYDHVDPDGDNSFSNVVVACRQCNGRKRDRTPEQWIDADPAEGMSLLRKGTTASQAADQRSRAGPTPGQPPANPRPTGKRASRARPDRVNPGSTPGQPDPHRHLPHLARPVPAGSAEGAPLNDLAEVPPLTDEHDPGEQP